jgi:hypothetical protein
VSTTGGSTAGIEVDAHELLALQNAFKAAGREAMKEARNVTNGIGRRMQTELRGAGMVGQGALAAHVARQAVKYERRQVFKGRDGVVRASKFTGGYVPVVAIGVGGQLPVSRTATEKDPHPDAAVVWAGTEFGAVGTLPNGAKRFPNPRNKRGYWFFPTWQAIKDDYANEWQQAMKDLLKKWELPGGFGG